MQQSIAQRKERLIAEILQLERQFQDLATQLKLVEAKLHSAKGGMSVLNELEAEQVAQLSKRSPENLLQIPAITLQDAVRKATIALKKFTRDDLEQWVRSNYPQVQFGKKSVDGAMRRLMNDGDVTMLRPNTGNKVPAVYGCRERLALNSRQAEGEKGGRSTL